MPDLTSITTDWQQPRCGICYRTNSPKDNPRCERCAGPKPTLDTPATTPGTVRVRALVIVDGNGKWTMMGDGQNPDQQIRDWAYEAVGDLGGPPWAEHWIEATVPLPVQTPDGTIEGEVAQDVQ